MAHALAISLTISAALAVIGVLAVSGMASGAAAGDPSENSPPSIVVTAGACLSSDKPAGSLEFVTFDLDGDQVNVGLGFVDSEDDKVLPPGSVTLTHNGDVHTLEVRAKAAGWGVITINLDDGTFGAHPLIPVHVGTNRLDSMVAGSYPDMMFGRDGADEIDAGRGNDLVCGGQHADQLSAGEGDDWVFGQGSADVLKGRAGDDHLFGGRGDDQMFGGSGEDTLKGGSGADEFSGGADTDAAADFDAMEGDAQDGTIP